MAGRYSVAPSAQTRPGRRLIETRRVRKRPAGFVKDTNLSSQTSNNTFTAGETGIAMRELERVRHYAGAKLFDNWNKPLLGPMRGFAHTVMHPMQKKMSIVAHAAEKSRKTIVRIACH